jgi:ATP-dependent helicase IRC3
MLGGKVTTCSFGQPSEPLVLRPYQHDCTVAVQKALKNEIRYPLISMTMGAGKTAVQAWLLNSLSTSPKAVSHNTQGIVIVHTKLLVEQTHGALKKFFGIDAAIEQGEREADPESKIIVACAASLVKRLSKYDPLRQRLIIIDECHHAVADTTKTILAAFNALKGTAGAQNFNGIVLGTTATPSRADGKGLDTIFEEIVYHIPMEDLINQGYLAYPHGCIVHSDVDLEQVAVVQSEYGMDFDPLALGKVIDTDQNNQLIVDCYEQKCKGMPTIVFCVHIKHAQKVAERFQKCGIRAVAVSYRTRKKELNSIMQAVRNREIDVICNVNLLSEGADFPFLQAAILAAPTASEPKYRQQIGRCMRLAPGKQHCVIVDIHHTSSRLKLSSLPTIFGIPEPLFEQQELVDILKVHEEVEKFKKENPRIDVSKLSNIEQLRRLSHFEEVRLVLAEPASELIELSKMPWLRNDPRTFTLAVSNTDYILLEKNLLNQYEIFLVRLGEPKELIGSAGNDKEATETAERLIQERFPAKLPLLSTDADWRKKHASKKQLEYIEKHKLEFDPSTAKRGDASYLVTANIERENKKLLLETESLMKQIPSDAESRLTTEAFGVIQKIQGQAKCGSIERPLYWRAVKIINALRAESILKELSPYKATPFFTSINKGIAEIKNSAGSRGQLYENGVKKLEEILKKQRVKILPEAVV